MKLIDMIVVIYGSEPVHVINGEKTEYFGSATKAIDELDDNVLTAKVKSVYTGFGNICIEIW